MADYIDTVETIDGIEYNIRTWTSGPKQGRVEQVIKDQPVQRLIKTWEWFDRWSDVELEGFENLCRTNDKAQAFKTRVMTRLVLDLDDVRLISGMTKLVNAELFTVARAQEIMV